MNPAYPNLKSWQPGSSGNPSGRAKKLINRVDEVLFKHGKHPIEELLKLIPELKPREQAQVWLDILPYVQAKPKDYDDEKAIIEDLKKLSTSELFAIVKANHPEAAKNVG